jgi:glycosyltransferase involved in cell wall biosynthesis
LLGLILYGTGCVMSSLRILHVVPYFEHAWAYGGIPRVAAAMTHGLARRGHHVTVCTTDACDAQTRVNRGDASARTGNPEVHVFRNVSNRLAYRYQAFAPWGLRRFLRDAAASFDVAHLHACRNLPTSIAAHALVRAGVPYVLSPNGTLPLIERRILLKRVFDMAGGRHSVEHAARVLATSEAERRQIVEQGIGGRHVTVLPNPLDLREFADIPDREAFRRKHRLGSGRVVLLLGKLTPRKGADILLDAFTRVSDTSARLVIAGNDMGGSTSSVAAVDGSIVTGRVTRIGLLRGGERLAALASADVVVYPSRHEVFGLVPLEALMCGTPVVVSNDSGCGEIIGRIGGGHLVPHGDRASLAGAIDAILNEPSVWRPRALAAGRRIRELFGADVVCERLETIYTGLAHPAGGRRSVA